MSGLQQKSSKGYGKILVNGQIINFSAFALWFTSSLQQKHYPPEMHRNRKHFNKLPEVVTCGNKYLHDLDLQIT